MHFPVECFLLLCFFCARQTLQKLERFSNNVTTKYWSLVSRETETSSEICFVFSELSRFSFGFFLALNIFNLLEIVNQKLRFNVSK